MKLVTFDTFPQEAGRKLFMQFNLESSFPLERVEASVDTFEEFLFDHQEQLDIRSVYSYFDEGRAQTMILLTEEKDATIRTADVIDFIEENMPEIVIGKPSFDLDQQELVYTVLIDQETAISKNRTCADVRAGALVRVRGFQQGLTITATEINIDRSSMPPG